MVRIAFCAHKGGPPEHTTEYLYEYICIIKYSEGKRRGRPGLTRGITPIQQLVRGCWQRAVEGLTRGHGHIDTTKYTHTDGGHAETTSNQPPLPPHNKFTLPATPRNGAENQPGLHLNWCAWIFSYPRPPPHFPPSLFSGGCSQPTGATRFWCRALNGV